MKKTKDEARKTKGNRKTVFVSDEAKRRLEQLVALELERGRRATLTSVATDIILAAPVK